MGTQTLLGKQSEKLMAGLWEQLPKAVRRLIQLKLALLTTFAIIALAIGNVVVPQGYEHVAFAVPAHGAPLTKWDRKVDHFADRVSKALGVRRSTAGEFSGWILEASQRHAFEPELIASLVLTESSFRKNVESHVGAVGPAQVRPEYWGRFCGTGDLWDPGENIYCGAQVLAYLRDQCGDQECALRAYNVGRYSQRIQAGTRYVDKIGRHMTQLGAL